MIKKEKYKIALAECQKVAPNVGDLFELPNGMTIGHDPMWFALHRKDGKCVELLEHDGQSEKTAVYAFLIELNRIDIVATPDTPDDPFDRLMFDLEALKQLPDDTSAAYIKDQITEATQRYYDTR